MPPQDKRDKIESARPCWEADRAETRREGEGRKELTLVTEAVTASISRSSADRSLKPGRTCLAWSLSRVATAKGGTT